MNATGCTASTEGKDRWVVEGADVDGERLRCVVVVVDGVIVITMF